MLKEGETDELLPDFGDDGEGPELDRFAVSPVLSNGTTLSDGTTDDEEVEEVAGVLVAEGSGVEELEQLVTLTTVTKENSNVTNTRFLMSMPSP